MNRRTTKKLQDSGPMSIGALSRATRIPVETLRTWERRYGAPVSQRKPSGHRLYTAASVEHLRRVSRLLGQGHRPAEILGLSVPELDRMISISAPVEAGPRPQAESMPSGEATLERAIRRMVRAAEDLDRDVLLPELRANWVRLGPMRFLQECAGVLMMEIGQAWQEKKLEIRHEHFAWSCLADFLREVREPYDHEARGPRVAVATLAGEAHEGGLLMCSVVLAMRGYRVVSMGSNTPVEQIAAAVSTGGAEAVAISVSAAASRAGAAKSIARLRELLPRRVPLWVGGAGAPRPTTGVECFSSLEALDARIATHR